VKGWFSLYEIKEAASQGGYSMSGIIVRLLRGLLAWTLKHGHFVIMGGIHLVEPVEGTPVLLGATAETDRLEDASDDIQSTASLMERTDVDVENGPAPPSGNKPEGRVTILTLKMLRELVRDPEFNIRITEDEVMHTSKGDALSKVIFILQSTWFITQCVARHVQGLGLTQLELTTLALASLNGITFILWWDKPLGAQTVVRVQMTRKLTDAERNEGGVSGFFVGGSFIFTYQQLQRDDSWRSKIIPTLQEIIEDTVSVIRDSILCQPEGLIQLPLAIIALLLFPIVVFTYAFVYTIGDLLGESTSFSADTTHVPTFHVPSHQYPAWLHSLLLMALGSIFGGIHCIGWNFPFPTNAEQSLWRVASLAVTIIPIGVIALVPILGTILKILICNCGDDVFVFGTTSGIVMFMYASARLLLLGQAIALLRHQPPSAFIAVDWTRFYPHFF